MDGYYWLPVEELSDPATEWHYCGSTCGDGVCDASESAETCAQDCGGGFRGRRASEDDEGEDFAAIVATVVDSLIALVNDAYAAK